MREQLTLKFARLHGHNDDSPDLNHPIFIMCADECIRQMNWARRTAGPFTLAEVVSDEDLCRAAGLNPWCIAEGLAKADDPQDVPLTVAPEGFRP